MENKPKKNKTAFSAREVAILIEDLRSNFRIFGDELKTITRKLKILETTTGKTWEKVTGIDLRLIRIEKDMNEIKPAFSKRLTALEATIK